MTQLNSGYYSSPTKASPALARVKQCQDMPWHWGTSCATSLLYQHAADGAALPLTQLFPPHHHGGTAAQSHVGQNQAPHLYKSPLPAAKLKSSSVLHHACSLLLWFSSSAPLRCFLVTHTCRRALCSLHLLFPWPESETTQFSCHKASPVPSPTFQHIVSSPSSSHSLPCSLLLPGYPAAPQSNCTCEKGKGMYSTHFISGFSI